MHKTFYSFRRYGDGTGTFFQGSALNYGNYLDEVWTIDKRSGGVTVADLNDGTGGQRHFYHSNTLYSVYALTDETGAIAEAVQSYDAYGKISALITGAGTDGIWFTSDDVLATNPNVSAIGNPWLFGGYRIDPETGLYYVKNRFFIPDLGRWATRDPIGYDAGSPGLYEYVGSRSTRNTDILGLESFSQCYRGCMGDAKQGDAGFEKKMAECAEKCKDKPANCHALVCGKSMDYAATLGLLAGMACVDDPLKIQTPKKIDRQVVAIRDALTAKKCESKGKESCDGKPGCVKLYLWSYGSKNTRIGVIDPGMNPDNDPDISKALDKWQKTNENCLSAMHSAIIDCGDKQCHHIPGMLQDERIVKSFKEVKLVDDKTDYPSDEVEYWQCPCP